MPKSASKPSQALLPTLAQHPSVLVNSNRPKKWSPRSSTRDYLVTFQKELVYEGIVGESTTTDTTSGASELSRDSATVALEAFVQDAGA